MSRRSWSRVLGAGVAGLLVAIALPLTGAAHGLPVDGATQAGPAVEQDEVLAGV